MSLFPWSLTSADLCRLPMEGCVVLCICPPPEVLMVSRKKARRFERCSWARGLVPGLVSILKAHWVCFSYGPDFSIPFSIPLIMKPNVNWNLNFLSKLLSGTNPRTQIFLKCPLEGVHLEGSVGDTRLCRSAAHLQQKAPLLAILVLVCIYVLLCLWSPLG